MCLQVGDRVRSFDFDSRKLEGPDACYIEGVIEFVGACETEGFYDCDRYKVKVTRQVFGGKVVHAGKVMHGKTSVLSHRGEGVFKGLDNPFVATRYHSLIVERKSLPSILKITAETKEKEIMGLQHKKFPVFGVQFHPESILTQGGKDLLRNFLSLTRA